jgi:hypothetical protein
MKRRTAHYDRGAVEVWRELISCSVRPMILLQLLPEQ